MKIIGVDFGSKRVGIAVADTDAGMAFPKIVLDNNQTFFDEFKKLVEEENADLVVLGESKDFEGKDNLIMAKINQFKTKIENELGLSVRMHPEFMTSAQAIHDQGFNEMTDASAATIILQAYIDKQTNNK